MKLEIISKQRLSGFKETVSKHLEIEERIGMDIEVLKCLTVFLRWSTSPFLIKNANCTGQMRDKTTEIQQNLEDVRLLQVNGPVEQVDEDGTIK